MPVYLHAVIQVRPGMMGLFNETMTEMAAALQGEGWTLVGSYVSTVGRLNEVVDIWEMPDANAMTSVLGALGKYPDVGKWIAALEECVEDEQRSLMVKTPFST